MFKTFLPVLAFCIMAAGAYAQSIDSLQLTDSEIPAGYTKSAELICLTPHSNSFYNQTDLYASFLGKVVKKSFQSFEKKGDTGSILYFEYEKEFEGQAMLKGLLWGEGSKPSTSEPDDYYAKGKILIIWSLPLKSELKKISKQKIVALLHK